MIHIEQLSRVFGDKQAVDRLSIHVGPGEILGLLGPNGAGKTTTLKICAGMLHPSKGTVRIDGMDVPARPLDARQAIGYAPEDASLFEALTAEEYLRLVADLRHLDPEESLVAIGGWLRRFGLTGEDRHARLSTASKGTKQKIVLIQALLHEPKVLLLDEPLSGLDPQAARILKDLLVEIAATGTAIIYSSHILDVVERICTRVGILHHGRLLADGAPGDLVDRGEDRSLERLFLRLTGARNQES
ncbi:MAG: hypothetical protein CME06_04415 [Gemmatimonadetes bacterium]|nr:hypothetical protein [Gemmatimonadota bacterium]